MTQQVNMPWKFQRVSFKNNFHGWFKSTHDSKQIKQKGKTEEKHTMIHNS